MQKNNAGNNANQCKPGPKPPNQCKTNATNATNAEQPGGTNAGPGRAWAQAGPGPGPGLGLDPGSDPARARTRAKSGHTKIKENR